MKTILSAVALTLALSAPVYAGENSTPRALACMKKFGFTYKQWRAYQVPPEKAAPYRACRDRR